MRIARLQRSAFEAAEHCAKIRAAAVENERHIEPAGNCQVRAAAGSRCAECDGRVFANRDRPPKRDRCAIDCRRKIAAANRHQRIAVEPQRGALQCCFKHGSAIGVADENIGHAGRESVHRAADADAVLLITAAAEVLNRGEQAGADHVDGHRRSAKSAWNSLGVIGRKRTISPARKRGRVFRGSKQCQRRAADQLPTAGSFQRVYAGLFAGDADRSGRHFQSRRIAAGRGDPRRHASEIRKTWSETKHVHQIFSAGMDGDDLFRRKAVDESQHVPDPDQTRRRNRRGYRQSAIDPRSLPYSRPRRLQAVRNVVKRDDNRVVVHRQRCKRRHVFGHSPQRMSLEPIGQRADAAKRVAIDLVAKLDERGRVAKWNDRGRRQ